MTISNQLWLLLSIISYLTVDIFAGGISDCDEKSGENSTLCGFSTNNVTATTQMPSTVTTVEERGSCSLPEDLSDTIKVLYEADPSQEISKGYKAMSYTTVIYKCQSQYVLQGNTTNICVDGRWSEKHPKCRKYCSPLTQFGASCEIFGETISCNQQLQPETTARISCAIGYQSLIDVHRCDDNGEWDYDAFRCISICGVKAPNMVPYIVGGETTDIIKVPWHVGIFSNIGDKDVFSQICGGTIVNAKLVISAAHCFWDAYENRLYEPANFKIGAGKSFRDFYAKEGTKPQIVNVEYIITAIEYRDFDGYYADDIALLILVDQLKFNSYINPICLETDLRFNETYVTPGLVGKIAGWGLEASGGNSSYVLKYIELPAVEYNECKRTLTRELQSFITADKFCAGYTTGQSVCQGDSGGGLVFPKEVGGTELYFLRGVVSTGGNKQGSCDNDKYTFFTNVQSHIKFVKYYKEQTESQVMTFIDKNQIQIDLECTYSADNYDVYRCTVQNLNSTLENLVVSSFTGTQVAEFTAQNVNEIRFFDGKMKYLPDGIGKKLKNLQTFVVKKLGLKLIKRSNFRNMLVLSKMDVSQNDLESVDEDTLWDLPNLYDFRITKNKLKVLHKKFFERNTKLHWIYANDNELEFLHSDSFKNNLLLRIVVFDDNKLEFLPADLFRTNYRLQEVHFENNRLTTILIDFTTFRYIIWIDFRRNICIDKILGSVDSVEVYQTLLRNQCAEVSLM